MADDLAGEGLARRDPQPGEGRHLLLGQHDDRAVPRRNGRPYQYLSIRNEVTKLKKVEQELKEMMTRVIQVQEEERKRISRELHDGVGQSLFSLLIRIDRLLDDRPELEELRGLRREVAGVMEDIRSMARELRPSVLDDLGVGPAVRTYVENYSAHYGIDVRTRDRPARQARHRGGNDDLPRRAGSAYEHREIRRCRRVRSVDQGDGRRGRGGRAGRRRGLRSVREPDRRRPVLDGGAGAAVGGTLAIRSAPDKGTEVRLVVPKAPADAR